MAVSVTTRRRIGVRDSMVTPPYRARGHPDGLCRSRPPRAHSCRHPRRPGRAGCGHLRRRPACGARQHRTTSCRRRPESSSSRTSRSSSAVGGGVVATSSAMLDLPADRRRGPRRWSPRDGASRGASRRRRRSGRCPRSVTTTVGPRPSQPPSRRMRSACSAPPRLPGDVRKSMRLDERAGRTGA